MSHAAADAALGAALAGRPPAHEPNAVLVGLALYDEDRVFVEAWCRRVAEESRDRVLVGTAALGLGHLARRFRELEPGSVMLVERLAERRDVDGRVFSALDDITLFVADGHT